MTSKLTGILAVIVALLLFGGGVGVGYLIWGKACPSDGPVLDPQGPSHTDPKPAPKPKKSVGIVKTNPCPPMPWNWKYCGTSIKFSYTFLAPYLTLVGEDDCKKTTQKYKLNMPMYHHDIYVRALLGVVWAPDTKTVDFAPGLGLGYNHFWGMLGLGGEFSYSQGLTSKMQIYQVSVAGHLRFN